MVIQFNDFSRVIFHTKSGEVYEVLPLPNSRLAIPKDIECICISFFGKPINSD